MSQAIGDGGLRCLALVEGLQVKRRKSKGKQDVTVRQGVKVVPRVSAVSTPQYFAGGNSDAGRGSAGVCGTRCYDGVENVSAQFQEGVL